MGNIASPTYFVNRQNKKEKSAAAVRGKFQNKNDNQVKKRQSPQSVPHFSTFTAVMFLCPGHINKAGTNMRRAEK
jgi:hypothetical protein